MKDLSKKFCKEPWEFIEIGSAKGDEVKLSFGHDRGMSVYNCCPSWVNNNLIGELKYDTNLESIWNGKKSIEFRKSILDGSFKYCNHTLCPMIQNGSLPNKDDIKLGKHGEFYKKIIEENILYSGNPNFINLCYDVSCNLSCPSCRKTFLFLNEKSDKIQFDLKLEFQKKLIEYLYTCKNHVVVNFTGSGDPFGSKLFFDFLQNLNGKLNENIEIQLQTNGVLFNKQNWEKLSKIHNLVIKSLISLDAGSEQTYKYTRRGGDWNILMKNLEFIFELYEKKSLYYVRLDCVVQNENYKELMEFVNIAKKYNFYCYFSRITLWSDTYTDEEFKKHNIFDENHSNHLDFIDKINQNFNYDKLDYGNLTEYLR